MSNLVRTATVGRPRRIVLLAGEAVFDGALTAVGDRRRRDAVDMLLVVPASAGRLALCTSDDTPRRTAERRLHRCLAALRARGIRAEGLVGDADPLLALDNALGLFPADQILVVEPTESRDASPARSLVAGARLRHGRPVHRVEADGAGVKAA
jgi:hypothetical protein